MADWGAVLKPPNTISIQCWVKFHDYLNILMEIIFHIILFFKDFIYLFLERGEEKEKER